MEVVESRFTNLKELYDQISKEITIKKGYTIYHLFIFWISIAIVLLVLQEIIEARIEKKEHIDIGIMKKLTRFFLEAIKAFFRFLIG